MDKESKIKRIMEYLNDNKSDETINNIYEFIENKDDIVDKKRDFIINAFQPYIFYFYYNFNLDQLKNIFSNKNLARI
jgi:hypothetical protein